MKTKKLTKNQLDIMKVLWKSEKALSASDITKNNPSLNLNTVRSCLQAMLKNGVIVVDDVVYSRTVLSRSYKPVLTAEKYIADNFSQGKYSRSVCSVEELTRATNRIKEPQTWRRGFEGTLELLSYREEERAEFELYRVIESLKDYLESRATSRWNVNWDMMWDTYENENRCFGMQCYEGIYHNIQIAREEKSFAESGHRALFLEQEHKKIMELRLQFIRERYPISEDIISEYHRLCEICGSAMCLKLKYDITKKEELLDRIEIGRAHV